MTWRKFYQGARLELSKQFAAGHVFNLTVRALPIPTPTQLTGIIEFDSMTDVSEVASELRLLPLLLQSALVFFNGQAMGLHATHIVDPESSPVSPLFCHFFVLHPHLESEFSILCGNKARQSQNAKR